MVIYPKKTLIKEDTCTPMLIAALFTLAKTWAHQPREWIRKIWSIFTRKYYLAIKNNEIMPFAETWMDLEIIILSEVSQI